MKKKTVDLFKCIAKQALKPIPKLSVSEWADNYRIISAEGASEPGRWRTDVRRISVKLWMLLRSMASGKLLSNHAAKSVKAIS